MCDRDEKQQNIIHKQIHSQLHIIRFTVTRIAKHNIIYIYDSIDDGAAHSHSVSRIVQQTFQSSLLHETFCFPMYDVLLSIYKINLIKKNLSICITFSDHSNVLAYPLLFHPFLFRTYKFMSCFEAFLFSQLSIQAVVSFQTIFEIALNLISEFIEI